MNETYMLELQEEINFLYEELIYIQKEILQARTDRDTDEYARLMRICLPMQKQYLKLCAEQEKRDAEENAADPLMEFNA